MSNGGFFTGAPCCSQAKLKKKKYETIKEMLGNLQRKEIMEDKKINLWTCFASILPLALSHQVLKKYQQIIS